jgi:hypothetical protein
LTPCCVKGLSCCGDSNVDILLGGFLDGADNLFVRGVDGLEGLAIDTLDELVVDETVEVQSAWFMDPSVYCGREKPGRCRGESMGYSQSCGDFDLAAVRRRYSNRERHDYYLFRRVFAVSIQLIYSDLGCTMQCEEEKGRRRRGSTGK